MSSTKYDENWLARQIEKDKKQIEIHKAKLIKELKNTNKQEILEKINKNTEKKETLLDKFIKIFK